MLAHAVPVRVKALCDEFAIEIVPAHRQPDFGQTRAVRTIERIIDRRGEAHARLVLSALAETKGNDGGLDESGIWAVSDLFIACADIIERDAGAALDMLDSIPFGVLRAIANELSGIIPQRYALAGMVYLYLRRLREDTLTGRRSASGLTRRANLSELEKGREPFARRRHRSLEEKVDIGRTLLAKKATLPRGHWGPWLKQAGMPNKAAQQCMRLAREADAAG